jgi:hypothetical protein
MQKLILALAVAVLVSGCGTAALLLLSDDARDDLIGNFEEAINAQQMISEHVFAASRGDIDISNYTYTPPAGGNPGQLTITDGTVPFGTGSLTINFLVTGDNGPVDPYDPAVDLSTHDAVSVVADFSFSGLSLSGITMSAAGDFTADAVNNNGTDVTADIAGNFDINHNGYDIDLATNDLQLAFDLAAREVTSVTGQVDGTVDIPNFFYDADFVVDGQGDQLQIGIDAVVEQINYFVALADL